MTTKHHIAKRGKNINKFVPCTAVKSCRNSGQHINHDTYKEVKKTYGEVNHETFMLHMQNRLQANPTPAAEEHITLPMPTTQKAFNKFLTDNSVKAVYMYREFVNGKLVETGEEITLYKIENLQQDLKELKGIKPYSTSQEAEAISKQTLEEITQRQDYGISNLEIKKMTQVIITKPQTAQTQTDIKQYLNILEDYNYHTLDAYSTALNNSQ